MKTITDDGGPAFPVPPNEPIHPGTTGMTLRDYFAVSVVGHLVAIEFRQENTMPDDVSYAYKVADAMIKARAMV